MKKVLSIFIISILFVNGANANQQDERNHPEVDQIIASLQLDDATAQQLKTLMESHHEEMKSLRDMGEQQHQQHRNKREQHRKDLLAILGYENMYKFEEIMHQQRPKHGKRRAAQ